MFWFYKYPQALSHMTTTAQPMQIPGWERWWDLACTLNLTLPKATVCCGIKCKCSTQRGHESQVWQILRHLTIKYDKNTAGPETGNSSFVEFSFKPCTVLEVTVATTRNAEISFTALLQLLCNLIKTACPPQQFPLQGFRWYIKIKEK